RAGQTSGPPTALIRIGYLRAHVRLEEDAQRDLRLHFAVAIADLLERHVADARETLKLFQLQEIGIEPVEVPAETHLDRLLAVIGIALALERLARLSRQIVRFCHLPAFL